MSHYDSTNDLAVCNLASYFFSPGLELNWMSRLNTFVILSDLKHKWIQQACAPTKARNGL